MPTRSNREDVISHYEKELTRQERLRQLDYSLKKRRMEEQRRMEDKLFKHAKYYGMVEPKRFFHPKVIRGEGYYGVVIDELIPNKENEMRTSLVLRPIPPEDPCDEEDRPFTAQEVHRALADVLDFIAEQGVFRVYDMDTAAGESRQAIIHPTTE